MSLTFKPGNNEEQKEEPKTEIETHDGQSGIRNISFVQLDGKRLFLNYAYLASGEFEPDKNIITLTFTTHVVILKGQALESLFNDLSTQKPKSITCLDKRYIATKNESEPAVTEIEIKPQNI